MANCADCDSQTVLEQECNEQEIILEQENVIVGSGTSDHSKLRNLDYDSAGHTGFQKSLVSGENIKTINNESILGSGNIDIQTDNIAWGDISGEITNQTDLQQEFSQYTPTTSLATVATSGDYRDLLNTPTIPTVNNATLTIQKNSTNIGTFTANASSNETINITVPTTAAQVKALPDSTKYGAFFTLTIDSSTYVVTATLKDQDGNTLGTAQTIDLPLESVVVGGSYDLANKKIILTLQNGNTIDIPVAGLVAGLQSEITAQNKLSADLVDDSTTVNKFVTASEKTTWNNKLDESDLSDYVKNTDYAGSNKAGVIKTTADYGTSITSVGALISATKTYQQYQNTTTPNMFISKGTLENVIAGKELVTNQDISGKANKISVVQTSASTIEINPNTFYKFGEVASLNITLASITDNTIYNEYMFEFVSGTTATTLTLPSSIKWLETPTIDANKIYQCSIVDNVGLLVGVANV